MIQGLPVGHSTGYGDGLAATNAMAVEGIRAGDNLLAVISWPDALGGARADDVGDFTVAAGTITAGTIDLTNRRFVAIWTEEPSA